MSDLEKLIEQVRKLTEAVEALTVKLANPLVVYQHHYTHPQQPSYPQPSFSPTTSPPYIVTSVMGGTN